MAVFEQNRKIVFTVRELTEVGNKGKWHKIRKFIHIAVWLLLMLPNNNQVDSH